MTAPEHAPALAGVLETVLYVDDLERAQEFYEGVLALSPMFADARMRAYPVGTGALLLFRRGASLQTVNMPGGTIPPHDGKGPLHVAFAVGKSELPEWETRLREHGVAIEGRARWPRGGESIYFRDADGNLLELATPGLWTNY